MENASEKSRGRAKELATDSHQSVAAQLKALAEPIPAGEPIKAAIARVARVVKLDYWRAWNIWHGKARLIDVAEINRIDEALALKNIKDARHELQELRTRLQIIESRLSQADANFHRENIGSLRHALRHSR